MSLSPFLAAIERAVVERAETIRLAVFDVDGVLTDGGLLYGEDGRETKRFHTLDGLGLKLLRQHGIEVALITARSSPCVSRRADELGLVHVYQDQSDKLACLTELLSALQLTFDQACYTGDDLPDLACMQRCGLAVTVPNAHPAVMSRAHWQTRHAGGSGAAREVCDLILHAQGHDADVLARFGAA